MATSENKTATTVADMVFAYIRRSPATRIVAPRRNVDAIRGGEMLVKRGPDPLPEDPKKWACHVAERPGRILLYVGWRTYRGWDETGHREHPVLNRLSSV
jgi:hypothetical protein